MPRRFRFALPLALPALAIAQTVPAGFTIDTLASLGVARPNDCCFLPDGRCLVASYEGAITVHAGTNHAPIGTVPNVQFGGELGLLSLAADPGFATNGYLYVYYSATTDTYMHLDRFTCLGDLANPNSVNITLDLPSRRTILGDIPDTAINHNGGSLRFAADGRLYLSIGDDSWGCTSQSLTSQSGCIVRLDVSGLPPGGSTTLPAWSALDPGDNPLSANTDFSQLVIAFGLRNPFRMEVDSRTGNLYIGDVGQDLVEELSEYVVPVPGDHAGATAAPFPLVNFGWPWREGDIPGPLTCGGGMPTHLVEPIAVVAHTVGQASILAGARYRNHGQPSDFGSLYEGDLFYLDYYTGNVRRLRQSNQGWSPAPPVPGQANATNWGSGFVNVTSLRLGPDGALWFTQHFPGRLRRLRPDLPANNITFLGGGGQRGPAGEAFPQPLTVRVLDAMSAPVVGAAVHFEVAGPGQLTTTNPLVTDPSGQASTAVVATGAGGAIAVTASTAGGLAHATTGLFARKVTAAQAGPALVVAVGNQTDALPAQVPYVLMLAFPGSPTLPTPLGTLCIDPAYALAVVLEDGIGIFGGISHSGSGGIGSPSLIRTYSLPAGMLTGQTIRFQAVGLDPLTGWFRTDCATVQF